MKNNNHFGKRKGQVIQANEERLKKHVSEVVWKDVENTLNSLETEADKLYRARRYSATQNG